jgi:hypothetical protein
LDLIDKKREDLVVSEENLKIEIDNLKTKEHELEGKLSELSRLSEDEAKELFLKQLEEKYSDD